jgi:hypothetical protein
MTVQDLQIEHPLVLLMPIGQKHKLPARFKDGGEITLLAAGATQCSWTFRVRADHGYVHFTPESGHRWVRLGCPLCAIRGH